MILARPADDGFMPKGVKTLNDVYTAQRLRRWPTSTGIWGIGPNGFGLLTGAPGEVSLPRRGLLTVPNVQATQLAAPYGDTSYLYAGLYFIRSNGTLWFQGFSYMAGTPIGNQQYTAPVQIGTDTNWERIWSVNQAWMALKNGGELWSVGAATNGRLFNGTTTPAVANWTRVQASFTWKKIAVGQSGSGAFTHLMAIRSDNTLWTVGSNSGGKTGQGVISGNTTTPTQVGTATDWADVACSGQSTSAIKTNGTLWTCGNSLYSVSNGASTLTQVGTDTDWSKVVGGPDYLMFHIKTNGTAYRSGAGTGSNAGGGANSNNGTLLSFDGAGMTWAWIAPANPYTVAMRTDGKLFYSGNAESAPFAAVSQTPQTNFVGLVEIGTLPPTAIGVAGTSSVIVSY